MKLLPAASPKTLTVIAAILAACSLATFAVGLTLLGAGFAVSDVKDQTAPSVFRADAHDAPEPAGFEEGRPVGLYFMTRFWIASGSLEKAVWYFTDDGRVYRDLEDGFADEVLALHKGPRGTARSEAGVMTVTWSDGKKTESEVERDGDAFSWDMGIFTPVKRFESDAALLGRWEGGDSISSSGGSATSSSTLDLRADGTFAQSRISSVTSRSTESVASAGAEAGSSGTWKRDDYTLTLTWGDGRTLRGITFPYHDGKSQRLFFAGTMYKKL
jgi:hypothetical protein